MQAENYCAKCGMPITRDFAGWTHVLPPMKPRDARKYRHVIVPLRFAERRAGS